MNRFVIDININKIFFSFIVLVIWCSGYFLLLLLVETGNHFMIHNFSCKKNYRIFFYFFLQCKSYVKVYTVTFDQCVVSLLFRSISFFKNILLTLF